MATINDIAEKLHISNATVSRALRSSGYVKAELKEKIFRTAEELGYAPNPLAVGCVPDGPTGSPLCCPP